MKRAAKVASHDLRTHKLIEEAQLGNSDAFDELYRAYKSQVFGLCLRLTKSRLDAEDLTQEVFIQARRKLPGFRGDCALSTWLHKIAFNMAMMFLRRPCVGEPSDDLAAVERDTTRLTLPPPFFAHEPVRYLALKRAIASLSSARRTVVILHDVNGFTHKEVGVQLGIPATTSKAQLHHAHVALRSYLGIKYRSNNQSSTGRSYGGDRPSGRH